MTTPLNFPSPPLLSYSKAIGNPYSSVNIERLVLLPKIRDFGYCRPHSNNRRRRTAVPEITLTGSSSPSHSLPPTTYTAVCTDTVYKCYQLVADSLSFVAYIDNDT